MAEGGIRTSSVKGSETSFDFMCSECLRNKSTSIEAVVYCPECDKHLCRHCYTCGHDIIGRRNVGAWKRPSRRAEIDNSTSYLYRRTQPHADGTITLGTPNEDKWRESKPAKFDPCQKHEGNMLQYYCPKDDVVCCPICHTSEHELCGNPVYIPLVTKEHKTELSSVKTGIDELCLKTDSISNNITTKLTSLDQTEQRLVTGVREFRARVDAMMDQLEKSSLNDIVKYKHFLKDRFKSELVICDTIKIEMNDLHTKLLDAADKDEYLLFSRIKQGNQRVIDKTQLLSDMICSEKSEEAVFKPNSELESLVNRQQKLGEIQPDLSVNETRIRGPERVDMKHSQAKRLPYVKSYAHCKIPLKLIKSSFKRKNTREVREIRGMCMTPSGHIILADWGSSSLIKLRSSPYGVTGHHPLKLKPTDVCHIETDRVAVALDGDTVHGVQFVTVTEKIKSTDSFSTQHCCNSLAYSNDTLYITEGFLGTAVHVYDLYNNCLRTITHDQHEVELNSTRCITTSESGVYLYITNKHGIITMDKAGKILSRFSSTKLGDGAYAVCVDGDGNVYVGGRGKNNVLQVRKKGDNNLTDILCFSGWESIKALCFDSVNSRLLVSSGASVTAHNLDLSS